MDCTIKIIKHKLKDRDEWKYKAEVAERALYLAIKCYCLCSSEKTINGLVVSFTQQAENELVEEEK